MAAIKTILHITPFFAPNIGGVETHLTDLIQELDHQNYRNIVLTYSPLTTTTPWQSTEKIGKHSIVYRFYWPGFNLFHRLEKFPLLNFLYITPYLLIRSIFFLIFNQTKVNTIHSHGLNSALIGNLLKTLFSIPRHITSIYSTYDNTPFNSLTTRILVFTLNHTDMVLTQSNSSVKDLKELGVVHINRYYHWVDLKRFKPLKSRPSIFTILFVGRMIPPKNALLLSKVARKFPNTKFVFVGTGPDFSRIPRLKNISLVGDVPYSQLHQYYQSCSVLCVPSRYHEGWGRIIAESISCGTPVISSNLGATIEAADDSVAIFIKPTLLNFINSLNSLIKKPQYYQILQKNCRPYALKHYSRQNLSFITQHY